MKCFVTMFLFCGLVKWMRKKCHPLINVVFFTLVLTKFFILIKTSTFSSRRINFWAMRRAVDFLPSACFKKFDLSTFFSFSSTFIDDKSFFNGSFKILHMHDLLQHLSHFYAHQLSSYWYRLRNFITLLSAKNGPCIQCTNTPGDVIGWSI